MSDHAARSAPDLASWSPAAVRLLQGAVYADDPTLWSLLLSARTPLENYFAKLGLLVVIDEAEGFAYLRQMQEDDYPPGAPSLPKLFRRTPLSYGATLLAVLLRDTLRRFEEEDVDNERCVVEIDQLFEDWKAFFPADEDEVRQHQQFTKALRKLEELKFTRQFSQEPEAWEIRRLLKARLPVTELELLRDQLQAAAQEQPSEP